MEDKNYPPPFQWVEFPEGRARFSGSIRSYDETGRETFCLQLGESRYFGEIKKEWRNDSHFNLTVTSFGYFDRGDVGMKMSPKICNIFTLGEINKIKDLTLSLISFFKQNPTRPFVMDMEVPDEFLGRVSFAENWALITSEVE